MHTSKCRLATSFIIRPRRSTTYVDEAYCYRPSSVLSRSVGSVTVVSPAETDKSIELPFGVWIRVGQETVY